MALKELAQRGAVNDSFAGLPLVVIYESQSATVVAFDRRLGERELTFRVHNNRLIDDQTGSVWDPVSGRARDGALAGSRLAPIAGTISHRRAWRTMHPDSEVHTGNGG